MIKLEGFKAGIYLKSIDYQYYVPEKINQAWDWHSPGLNQLLEKAAIRLGELNSFSRFVPNIDLFIQIHVTKEAIVSSRIEGTRTNMEEALMPETEIMADRRHDWHEVNNYVRAMNRAIENLDQLPLSGRLLRQTHEILMENVRGENKMPGQFRSSQNWIGGASLRDAAFIPPRHELVAEFMGDLELFLHNDDFRIPDLIKAAIAHYQFETIHPFLDGNGRIGRLLITLYFVSKKILDKPLLYLSVFFEKDKQLYYDNLTRVRQKNDMKHWIEYFLIGIEQTATAAIETLQKVLKLKEETEFMIQKKLGRRAVTGVLLLKHLLQRPAISVEQAMTATGLSYKAANDLVQKLVQHGVLKEMTGQSRNRIFVFEEYLNAFRG